MNKVKDEAVLFIGGPWDGQRRMLRGGHPLWSVAVGPTLAAGYEDLAFRKLDEQQVAVPYTQVTYERFKMPGDVIVYVVKPEPYTPNSLEHPYVRIIQQLAEGYRNFARQ